MQPIKKVLDTIAHDDATTDAAPAAAAAAACAGAAAGPTAGTVGFDASSNGNGAEAVTREPMCAEPDITLKGILVHCIYIVILLPLAIHSALLPKALTPGTLDFRALVPKGHRALGPKARDIHRPDSSN